jgi:hypothetical protein
VLRAKGLPPAHAGAVLEADHYYVWPLTGAERRAVSYRIARGDRPPGESADR